MKKYLTILLLFAFASCGPGKWVGGNQQHFDQRKAAKERKVNGKPEFDNSKKAL